MIEVYRGNYNDVMNIQNLLQSNGIESFVMNEVMGNIEPWVVSPGGFKAIALRVSDENLEASIKIIEDFNNRILSLDSE